MFSQYLPSYPPPFPFPPFPHLSHFPSLFCFPPLISFIYTAAAFVKRVMRIALTAPPSGTLPILPYNLSPPTLLLPYSHSDFYPSFHGPLLLLNSSNFFSPGIVLAMAFAHNVMQIHPSTQVLLHRSPLHTSSGKAPVLLLQTSLGSDPFDANNSNPAQCSAINSSLWELLVRLTSPSPPLSLSLSLSSPPLSLSPLTSPLPSPSPSLSFPLFNFFCSP